MKVTYANIKTLNLDKLLINSVWSDNQYWSYVIELVDIVIYLQPQHTYTVLLKYPYEFVYEYKARQSALHCTISAVSANPHTE